MKVKGRILVLAALLLLVSAKSKIIVDLDLESTNRAPAHLVSQRWLTNTNQTKNATDYLFRWPAIINNRTICIFEAHFVFLKLAAYFLRELLVYRHNLNNSRMNIQFGYKKRHYLTDNKLFINSSQDFHLLFIFKHESLCYRSRTYKSLWNF